MDDRNIMENILLTTKGACDLFMHGAIESSTPNVREAFSTALNSGLAMQDAVYGKMSQMGWYDNQQAPQQQAEQVKSKFTPHC